MPREPVAGEGPVGDECGAAVRIPVADVDVRLAEDAPPLARLAAGRARSFVAETGTPAVGSRFDPVRDNLQPDALALEHRLDQLVKARRDHDGREPLGELVESLSHLDVLDDPADHL